MWWTKLVLAVSALAGLVTSSSTLAESLIIPAFTAYTEPNADGARISARSGFSNWKDSPVLWFGEIKTVGELQASVQLRLPSTATSKLRLTIAGTSHVAEVQGAGTNLIIAQFGEFNLVQTGYHRFALEALDSAPPHGDLVALVLDGPAIRDAHFNLQPRRNAASVHLRYPVPKETTVTAFYCEVTGLEDPIHTYYMACGWHRGYFGMQVNSPTERRIIFSVWDSGGESTNRRNVADENRVTLIAKGPDVYSGDFGNEGTGGHSHLKYNWKTGEPQRFLVIAQPTNGTFTIFAGHWFDPEKKEWRLISSWRAPHEGGGLRSLYSFSENFVGNNGHLLRKARFGNQWICRDDGQWIELVRASFSHDPTGKTNRLDRFMGVENGQFFLSHGGFVSGFTASGEAFTRPATGKAPTDFELSSGTPKR